MTPDVVLRTLNDDTTIPAVGFGTYPLTGEECVTALAHAVEAGYRLFDTALNYGNEAAVGEGLRRTDLDRSEYQVVTKLPGRHHAYDLALESARQSLETLDEDYLDLYLIHWPNPSQGRYIEAWRALVELRRQGLVKSIGVSNFTHEHLRRIVDDTGVVPAVNQIEMHPYFPQQAMRRVHAEMGITTMAWSPMGKRSAPFREQPVAAAAEAHDVSPGQVIIRWHVQMESVPIPKSADPGRQRQNLDVFGFSLTDDEMAAISGLGRRDGRLFGGDPDIHEEM